MVGEKKTQQACTNPALQQETMQKAMVYRQMLMQQQATATQC